MTIDDFEKLISLLLQDLRARGVGEIEPGDIDLYWTIVDDEWRVSGSTPQPAVGSIDDDLAELGRSLTDPERRSLVDVTRCAAVLRLLSIVAAR